MILKDKSNAMIISPILSQAGSLNTAGLDLSSPAFSSSYVPETEYPTQTPQHSKNDNKTKKTRPPLSTRTEEDEDLDNPPAPKPSATTTKTTIASIPISKKQPSHASDIPTDKTKNVITGDSQQPCDNEL